MFEFSALSIAKRAFYEVLNRLYFLELLTHLNDDFMSVIYVKINKNNPYIDRAYNSQGLNE